MVKPVYGIRSSKSVFGKICDGKVIYAIFWIFETCLLLWTPGHVHVPVRTCTCSVLVLRSVFPEVTMFPDFEFGTLRCTFILLVLIFTEHECLVRHDIFGENYFGRRKPHIDSREDYCVTDCRGRRNVGVICETKYNRTVRCDVPFCSKYNSTKNYIRATDHTHLRYRISRIFRVGNFGENWKLCSIFTEKRVAI